METSRTVASGTYATEIAKLAIVLWAANMSLGVQVLAELAAEAARRLAEACAAELRQFTLGDGVSSDN